MVLLSKVIRSNYKKRSFPSVRFLSLSFSLFMSRKIIPETLLFYSPRSFLLPGMVVSWVFFGVLGVSSSTQGTDLTPTDEIRWDLSITRRRVPAMRDILQVCTVSRKSPSVRLLTYLVQTRYTL